MPSTAEIFATDRSQQMPQQKSRSDRNAAEDDDRFARTLDDVREPAAREETPRADKAEEAAVEQPVAGQSADQEQNGPDKQQAGTDDQQPGTGNGAAADDEPVAAEAGSEPGAETGATTEAVSNIAAAAASAVAETPVIAAPSAPDAASAAAGTTQAVAQQAGVKAAAVQSTTAAQVPVQTRTTPDGPASQLPEIPEILPRAAGETGRIDLAALKGASRTAATAISSAQAATDGSGGFKAAALQAQSGGQLQAAMQAGNAAPVQTPLTQQQARQPIQVQLPAELQQAQPVQGGETPATTQTLPLQTTGGVQNATGSQAPSFAQQMAQAQSQPPAQQLGIHIARGARDGVDRIEIQLHPQELGRVEVRMELGHDGRIMAVVSAERAETLEQLRRDVHQLEKALADSGFNTDRESFQFAGGQDDNGKRDGNGGKSLFADNDDLPDAMVAQRAMRLDRLGVDISV